MWLVPHIIATDVFKYYRKEVVDEVWRNTAKLNTFINNNNKKVVLIKGATGTGKSHLSVDVVTHFRGEVINSNKMQVYKGLDIVTNKIAHAEKQNVKFNQIQTSRPKISF
ncbi:hypothetical protein H5410_001644 [Solanum commersonii]|uniref:Helicase/UvrB N-terminal domain-containing protein n=1 Tax=Solanum commersonii TaxID=4109 RepID=A0A9J6B0N9_SOLCO|nr:hypothetical protein H5410_001644 [Solanum commersonii]